MIKPENQLQVTNLGIFGKYKYRLDADYSYQTEIYGNDIDQPYIRLTPDGLLTLKKGYCWNGASGPTWDTKSCRRGSALHDAGYSLMALGLISTSYYKAHIDQVWLHDICIEDGMWEWRAGAWLWAVTQFGGNHIQVKGKELGA